MGFIIRGFIWKIPILIFAYVFFWALIGAVGWSSGFPTEQGVLGELADLFGSEATAVTPSCSS